MEGQAQLVTVNVARYAASMDAMRAYWVVVDGKKVGTVKNGRSSSFSIPPGEHTITMKIDWLGSRSLNFTAGEGDTVNFRTGSSLRGLRAFLAIWYVVFDRFSYIALEQVGR